MSISPEPAGDIFTRIQAGLPVPPDGFYWLLVERKSTVLPDECWLMLLLKRSNRRPGWRWLDRTVAAQNITDLFYECPWKMEETVLAERICNTAHHLLSPDAMVPEVAEARQKLMNGKATRRF